ncbi:helix-turn-helix domain-containing protein [Streptomyces xiamenensis]|uniref:helix-turn-helix domain-containing protein n=1 Tax=Streptomyces xiamenensis TaxID=408015 RepID=UPI0035DE982C
MQPSKPPSPDAQAIRPADEAAFGELLAAFNQELGVEAPSTGRQKRLKNVHFEYEAEDRTVHDMAGTEGYSLASNWFLARLAQLIIAHQVSISRVCVFLLVVSAQRNGTGIAHLTQQQITDTLNRVAERLGGRNITRNTVNKSLKDLYALGWLEQVTGEDGKRINGQIRVNPYLWFRGNSRQQQGVLFDLQQDRTEEDFPNAIGPEDEAPLEAAG